MTDSQRILPIHPDEGLVEDFAEGFRMTVDAALRRAKRFGPSAEFGIELQRHGELDSAEDIAGEQITLTGLWSIA